MGYCTLDNISKHRSYRILERIVTGGDGVIEHDHVEDMIEYVSAEIDSYLSQRYSVPLSSVPQIIKFWAIRLCIAELYRYQSQGMNESDEKEEKRIYERLDLISKSKLSLDGATELYSGVEYPEWYEEDKFDDDTLEVSGILDPDEETLT